MKKFLRMIPVGGKWLVAALEWKDVIDKGSELYSKYQTSELPEDIKDLLCEIGEARSTSAKLFK
jgi:hypothetical protein